MSKAEAPADINYILVRANAKGSSSRRVLFVKPLAALKKACQAALKEKQPILSLLTEDGTPIQSIDDIKLGMTVIGSTEDFDIKKVEKQENIMSFAEIEALGFIGQTRKVDPFDPTARSVAMSQIGSARPSGMTSDQVSMISGGQSISTYGRSISRAQRTDFNESTLGRSTMSRRRLQNTAPTNISMMLNSLIPESKSLADVDFLIRSCQEKEFILNLLTFEDKQRQYWFTNVLNQSLFNSTKDIDVYKEIQEYATEEIKSSRFVSGQWVDHVLRIGIIGPKKSGKTVLLNEIAKQYISEIAYTGRWKHCFVFALNIEDIIPLFSNLAGLLTFFVEQTIDAIILQKPVMQTEFQSAKKQLLSILEEQAGDVKLSSTNILAEVTIQLSTYWRNPDAAIAFLDYVLSLPSVLSRIAGFDEMLWVIDNIDLSDIQISDVDPFNKIANVEIIEHIKLAINNHHFLIACHDTEKFLQTMNSVIEDGIDILGQINLISTFDIATPDEDDQNDHFALRLANHELPINLSFNMCGGVVHYLHEWDQLGQLMNNLDASKNDEQAEDNLFELLAHAQRMFELLYQYDTSEEIIVENISRITCINAS